MSQENVEIVRAIHDGWDQGTAPARAWSPPTSSDQSPLRGGGRHPPRPRRAGRGPRCVSGLFNWSIERYIDAGDDVVVIGISRHRRERRRNPVAAGLHLDYPRRPGDSFPLVQQSSRGPRGRGAVGVDGRRVDCAHRCV